MEHLKNKKILYKTVNGKTTNTFLDNMFRDSSMGKTDGDTVYLEGKAIAKGITKALGIK